VSDNVIELTDASVRFSDAGHETWGLRAANITFRVGLATILGVSGSGKSTLLSIVGLLRRPTTGTVTFLGKRTSDLSGAALDSLRAGSVGFVFQDHALVPHLSILENVMLPLLARKASADTGKALELLQRVGLGDHIHKLPSQISLGQAQRAALCRGLAGSPQVILADEVTASLDSASAQVIIDVLREAVEAGIIVILATHDERLAQIADSVVRLQEGRVLT